MVGYQWVFPTLRSEPENGSKLQIQAFTKKNALFLFSLFRILKNSPRKLTKAQNEYKPNSHPITVSLHFAGGIASARLKLIKPMFLLHFCITAKA